MRRPRSTATWRIGGDGRRREATAPGHPTPGAEHADDVAAATARHAVAPGSRWHDVSTSHEADEPEQLWRYGALS